MIRPGMGVLAVVVLCVATSSLAASCCRVAPQPRERRRRQRPRSWFIQSAPLDMTKKPHDTVPLLGSDMFR